MSNKIIELRNLLEQVFDDIASESGVASTQDVVAAFRSRHPQAIRECSIELENMALGKLLDSVSRRIRNPFRTSPQPDLFAGFHGVPKSIVVPSGKSSGGRFKRKLLPKATLQETMEWISEERRATKAKLHRYRGVADLVRELVQYASKDDTIENALKARAAAKKAA